MTNPRPKILSDLIKEVAGMEPKKLLGWLDEDEIEQVYLTVSAKMHEAYEKSKKENRYVVKEYGHRAYILDTFHPSYEPIPEDKEHHDCYKFDLYVVENCLLLPSKKKETMMMLHRKCKRLNGIKKTIYWASIYSGFYADEGCTEPSFPYWITGMTNGRRDGLPKTDASGRTKKDCVLTMIVQATTEEECWGKIKQHFPDMDKRFIEEKPHLCMPDSDRFPQK